MAILDISVVGDDILRKKSEIVTDFDEKLNKFVDDMIDTMIAYDGIGLAANQVGVDKRIFVIYYKLIDKTKDFLVLINPELTAFEGKYEYEEGCLSVPGIFENVIRPEKVEVKFQDIDGNEHKIEADGLLARVIQHENDHLDGILFIDRIPKTRLKLLQPQLKKIQNI